MSDTTEEVRGQERAAMLSRQWQIVDLLRNYLELKCRIVWTVKHKDPVVCWVVEELGLSLVIKSTTKDLMTAVHQDQLSNWEEPGYGDIEFFANGEISLGLRAAMTEKAWTYQTAEPGQPTTRLEHFMDQWVIRNSIQPKNVWLFEVLKIIEEYIKRKKEQKLQEEFEAANEPTKQLPQGYQTPDDDLTVNSRTVPKIR